MHPECAGLPGVPEGDWYCPKHASAAKAGKATKKAPAKPGRAPAGPPKGKEANGQKKKQKREESSLARQSSIEETAPVPKKKKKLVKAGNLQKAQAERAGEDGRQIEDSASEQAAQSGKKQEGKAGKPSVGLKVKLKKAKAPE